MHWLRNLRFHYADQPELLCFSKRSQRDSDTVLVVVNLDPKNVQATMVHVPIEQMGIGQDEDYVVHDLMTGARFTWHGARNYVRLDPDDQVAHVLRVER